VLVSPWLELLNPDVEALSSLALQLTKPGVRFVYDVQAHCFDLKTPICVIGAPGVQLARATSAEMGGHRGLLVGERGYAG